MSKPTTLGHESFRMKNELIEVVHVGRLAGKVAIVTGSTSGVGKGTARMMAKEGARVTVTGRNASEGKKVVDEIRADGGEALFVQADLTKRDECARFVEETVAAFGGLDILVNNAAIFPRGGIDDTTEAFWDEMMAVNLKAPFFCCQLAVPHMRKRGGGSIVNIGSINAFIGSPNLLPYSTSKGGLMTFTKNLASALAKERIRVNLINPGWVLTEGEHEMQLQLGQPENWAEIAAKQQPFGRLLGPDDIAYGVLYLASDEAALVSGAVLTINQEPIA